MWIGIGIAIFTGVGVSLSVALNMPGLLEIGPAIGVALGVAIGQSIENKYRKEGKIRSQTRDERKKRKILITAGVSILILGILIFLLKWFL